MLGSRAVALVGLALGACVSPVSLENRPCPCVESAYRCCSATQTCVRQTVACPLAQPPPAQEPPTPVSDAPLVAPDRSDAAAPDSAAPAVVPTGSPRPDAVAPDAAAPDVVAADAALPDRPADVAASGPRWQTLSSEGLSKHLAADFDLRVAEDGTPYLLISKVTLPTVTRATIVLRYDGSGWQQLGSELPGSEVSPRFVLADDGTPHVLVAGLLHVYGADWQEPPLPPAPLFLPKGAPVGLARDAQGRLYMFGGSPATDGACYHLGVLRLTGTRWELVGRADALGRATINDLQLAADRAGPYVSETDIDDVLAAHVRRWNGRDWVLVGGDNFAATDGAFAVGPDGNAYFAPPGAQPIKKASASGPWMDLPARTFAGGEKVVRPGLAVSADGVLHVADLGDQDPGPAEVPGPVVSRLDGNRFTPLTVDGLAATLFDRVKLAIKGTGGAAVLTLAYSRDLQIVVARLAP